MKRLGIFIFIFVNLLLGIKCQAQSQFSDTLTRMEKSLFGVDYSTQSDDARIKRIEESVYGATSSNPIQQRFNKLSKDLSADLIGQEIKPKTDTFADDSDNEKEFIPKADSNINYPTVDNLEKTVFNKVFKNNDINKRLSNLEQNVFKKTYNDDLNSRVDRLKMAIMPENSNLLSSNSDEESDNLYTPDDVEDQLSKAESYHNKLKNSGGNPSGFGANIPSYNQNNSVLDDYNSNADLDVAIGALEKKVLKKNFPNDTISNRLLRMEVKIFNSTFSDDDEQTRFDRIASAYQAKKTSSKYDDNKFSQHAAAAMQIGAFLLMILAAVL